MKLGIAIWNGRVSPVFDSSQRLEVLDVEDGQVRSRREEEIGADDPCQKAARLDNLGIATLICGAVSRSLADLLVARGIHILPFVCGGTEEVLSAFLEGRLPDPSLAMPGCCGRRRRMFGAEGGYNPMAPDGCLGEDTYVERVGKRFNGRSPERRYTMPNHDGTGPAGAGSRTGRGVGAGTGKGLGLGPRDGRGCGKGCGKGRGARNGAGHGGPAAATPEAAAPSPDKKTT